MDFAAELMVQLGKAAVEYRFERRICPNCFLGGVAEVRERCHRPIRSHHHRFGIRGGRV
jgi:hypothetical protein